MRCSPKPFLRSGVTCLIATVLLAVAALSIAAPITHLPVAKRVAPKPLYTWSSSLPPPAPVICIHFPPSMPMWEAKLLIRYAKDLGAQYIRFDVRWNVVEPEKGVFNMTALARYKHIIEYMESLGIYPIVIVGTGIPGWAANPLKNSPAAFLNYAKQYAAKVSKYLGYDVTYYQLGNELNHPLNIILKPYIVPIAPEYIIALGEGIKSGNPYYVGIVNVYTAPSPEWINILISWIRIAGKYFNIIAIDYYPGTWTLAPPSDWIPLELLVNVAKEYGKIPAVMETGYSTWNSWIANEQDQVNYINQAFPAILNIAQKHYVAFLSWYELIDEKVSWVPQEQHFGVLRTDFSKKPGYYTLSRWFHYLDNLLRSYHLPCIGHICALGRQAQHVALGALSTG